MNIKFYLEKKAKKVEKALLAYLPKKKTGAPALHEAMKYAVMSGGKRIRPILVLAACEAVGGDSQKVMPAACAIELVHNYSLIHDDLPCMDNDDLRRGRPTCHKKFGEYTALLAGDALLTLAFQILTSPDGRNSAAALLRRMEAACDIAKAIGMHGMIGGQAVDMDYQKKEPDLPTLEYINTHKTGALIAVSLKAGAMLGGGSPARVKALHHYGKYLGLLFQIVDDILDKEGYAKTLSVTEAKNIAKDLLMKAKREIAPFGKKALTLSLLADFVFERNH